MNNSEYLTIFEKLSAAADQIFRIWVQVQTNTSSHSTYVIVSMLRRSIYNLHAKKI